MSGKMQVMVVDDSVIIRKLIGRIIEGTRFELVGNAFDGRDAMQQFIKLRPQLVTMDLTMPNMDGLEAIDNMIRIDPKVKILVISALRDKKTAMQAIRLGGSGFLYKPFTELELTRALSTLFKDITDNQ